MLPFGDVALADQWTPSLSVNSGPKPRSMGYYHSGDVLGKTMRVIAHKLNLSPRREEQTYLVISYVINHSRSL